MEGRGDQDNEVFSTMYQLDNKYESLVSVIWISKAGSEDTKAIRGEEEAREEEKGVDMRAKEEVEEVVVRQLYQRMKLKPKI